MGLKGLDRVEIYISVVSVLGLCGGPWSESISFSSWLVGFSCSLLSLVLRDMMMNKKKLSWLIS